MPENQPVVAKCYQCGKDNPAGQSFCGACGSALALSEYISQQVKSHVAESVQDRDVLERDSSIRVFTQAWGWLKLIFGIAVALLVLTGAGVFWKASDFWTNVGKAQQSVIDTANTNKEQIAQSAAKAKQEINGAANDSVQQSQALKSTAAGIQSDMQRQMASLRQETDSAHQELQAASKIQPEVESMREQLSKATGEIQAQQKVISSSQDFVKSVFGSHMVEIFAIGQPPQNKYAVVPPDPQSPFKNTVVWLLLNSSPIDGTLQLQYYISLQPPTSYFRFAHNLVVFFWSDPAGNLKEKPLTVSYFPDTADKELIHSLSEHDARVWADDQPLPKIGAPDPDFKGNKWMQQGPTAARP